MDAAELQKKIDRLEEKVAEFTKFKSDFERRVGLLEAGRKRIKEG